MTVFTTPTLLLVILANTNLLQVNSASFAGQWTNDIQTTECPDVDNSWLAVLKTTICSTLEQTHDFLDELSHIDKSAMDFSGNANKYLENYIRNAVRQIIDWIYSMKSTIDSIVVQIVSTLFRGQNVFLTLLLNLFTYIPNWWWRCSL